MNRKEYEERLKLLEEFQYKRNQKEKKCLDEMYIKSCLEFDFFDLVTDGVDVYEVLSVDYNIGLTRPKIDYNVKRIKDSKEMKITNFYEKKYKLFKKRPKKKSKKKTSSSTVAD